MGRETEETMNTKKKLLAASFGGGLLAGMAMWVIAGDVPLSFQANPDVYKVLAENDEMRVVLATWPAGHKDKSHSHPMAAVYTIKECHARITTPDGAVKEVNNKAGLARVNPAVKSHTFENIGKSECQQLLVERKK
jgi:hypothetical protein